MVEGDAGDLAIGRLEEAVRRLGEVAGAFGLAKVLFGSAGASGDCCTPALPWGELPVAAFLGRCRVATGRDGLLVRYLDLADLIRMRRAIGRPKDLRRASELERLAGGGGSYSGPA
jgi:hypothetical protein